MRLSRFAGIATLLGTLAACEAAPLGPDVAEDPLNDRRAATQTPAAAHAPLLDRLFEQAVKKVQADHGATAATRITESYQRLRREARAASAAGDTRTAEAKRQAADAEAAAVVVRVLGAGIVDRVLVSVNTDLATLNARVATEERSGSDVQRLKEAAARVSRLYNGAVASQRDGRLGSALLLASQAFDLLASVRTR